MIFTNSDVKQLLSVEIKGTLLVFNFKDGRTEKQILKERKERHKKMLSLSERYYKLTKTELEVFKQWK